MDFTMRCVNGEIGYMLGQSWAQNTVEKQRGTLTKKSGGGSILIKVSKYQAKPERSTPPSSSEGEEQDRRGYRAAGGFLPLQSRTECTQAVGPPDSQMC